MPVPAFWRGQVQPFVGTDQDALTYVLSVNQHRRDLSKSQRAAVAATLILLLSVEIQARRAEKISHACRKRGGAEILTKVSGSPPGQVAGVTARAIAAARRAEEWRDIRCRVNVLM